VKVAALPSAPAAKAATPPPSAAPAPAAAAPAELPDPWEGTEEEAEAPSPEETAPPAPTPAKTVTGKAKKKVAKVVKPPPVKRDKDGRPALKWGRKPRRGAKLMGAVVPDERLRTKPLPRPSGNLHIFTLFTRETVKVNIYNDDGSYNIEALQAVNHMLRCKRTGAEREVDPRLLTLLSHIYDHYGKRLEVVSGFRNQRRTTSFHFRASASDIRIEGVKPTKLRDYVDTLDGGGMGLGLYPRAQFVHVDVRPLPSYRWIDYARGDGPESSDKKPPKGWKRKKLTS
jgi:uncharacterized protein YcbK (DUF882 family)